MKILKWFYKLPFRCYVALWVIAGIRPTPAKLTYMVSSQYKLKGYAFPRLFEAELIVDITGERWIEKVTIFPKVDRCEPIEKHIFHGKLIETNKLIKHGFRK